jgi:hypothetical protein
MPESEVQEMIALALVFVVHVIGGLALVWALLDDDTRAGWRRRWFGGGEDERDPTPPAPRPAPVVAPPPLPLSASDPARARLRGPGRLGDLHPPAQRRPDHVPQPARTPR